jgi:hypothetical protein
MNKISYFLISLFLIPFPVFAQTEIELDNETPLKKQVLEKGEVKLVIDYEPINFGEGDFSTDKNVRYVISYQGEEQIVNEVFTMYSGSASLQDLDQNGTPEVIIETYSGGAHCCTNFLIYTWNNKEFIKIETGLRDGSGGEFTDLDNDDKIEFVTADNAFLYYFSSYAGSFPPTMIFQLEAGQFQEVTHQYPEQLQATAWKMYQLFLDRRHSGEVNGILAGYVAQKILLGEYQEGWNFMLANYDRSSRLGLEIYEGQTQVGTYPDFPTALRAFLIEQGYLNQEGDPIQN